MEVALKQLCIQVDNAMVKDEDTGEMVMDAIFIDIPDHVTPVEVAQAIEILWPKATYYSIDANPTPVEQD